MPFTGIVPAREMFHACRQKLRADKGEVIWGFKVDCKETAGSIRKVNFVLEVSVPHEIAEAYDPLNAGS